MIYRLYQVAPHMVDAFWPQVRHWIKEAIDRCHGDDTEGHQYWKLKTQRAQLWIVAENNQDIIAAGTTEIMTTNSGVRLLQIATIGGSGAISKYPHLWPQMEQYAREEGCKKIRFAGRPGWSKLSALKDYHQPWLIFERDL